MVISDVGNQRVRVVAESNGTFYGQKMTAGDTYAIAGGDKPGFSGDGGSARKASLDGPDDPEHVIELFRLGYERAVRAADKRAHLGSNS